MRHDGKTILIKEISTVIREEIVYNLSVANTNTFFVGDDGLLVHNCPEQWGRNGFKGGNGKHRSTKNGKGRGKKKHQKNHSSKQGDDKKRDSSKGWYQR